MAEDFTLFKNQALDLGLTDPKEIRDYIRQEQQIRLENQLKEKEMTKQLQLQEQKIKYEISMNEQRLAAELAERETKLTIENAEIQRKAKLEEDKLAIERKEKEDRLAIERKEREDRLTMERNEKEVQAQIQMQLNDRNYEIQRLQAESAIRQQSEISARSSETQIRLAEIQSSASNTNINNTNNCRQIRDMPRLQSLDRSQIDNYLSHFERVCKLNEIPETNWLNYLTSKIPSNLLDLLVKLPTGSSYRQFLASVRKRYLLNADYYRSKFYAITQEYGESNSEVIRKLSESLDDWLLAEKVTADYQSLHDFIIRNQFFRKLGSDKSVFLMEHQSQFLEFEELARIADLYDIAHLKDSKNKKVNNYSYNNFNSNTNNGSQAKPTTQNTEPVSCTNCGKSGHTVDKCFSKKTDKSQIICSHCKKSGHSIDSCYSLHGKPNIGFKTKSGPQNSSTHKGKLTHQAAAVNVCEPTKVYMTFENSSNNKEVTNDNETRYSQLENTEESEQTYTSCTIVQANVKTYNKKILNPYSKAEIQGSNTLQKVLRDSGSFVSIIKRDLVPTNSYTNRVMKLQFANGTVNTVPTALLKIRSKFFTGVMEFAVLENPVSPVIIGNMPNVNESFDERSSEFDFDDNPRVDSSNEQSDETVLKQTTNQHEVENKLKFEQKTEISPAAEQQKVRNSEQNLVKHEQSLNNNVVDRNEVHNMIVENQTNEIDKMSVSTQQTLTKANEESIKFIKNVDSVVFKNSDTRQFPTLGNANKQELVTRIEHYDNVVIPITAVLTRSKTKQLSNSKQPNLDLQIPDITADKFREMQKSDIGLDRFWKIAQGKIVQEDKLKATFLIKKGLLYRKPVRPRGLGECKDTQLVIPSELRHIVLRTAHESVLGCHMGTKKTTQRIQVNFWFEGIVAYTHRYCKSCDVCQRTIKHGIVPKAPMLISKLSDAPFSRIACDLVGPIIPASSSGYSYILTIIDMATRYPDAIPLKRITTSKVADTLKDFFFRMGIPDVITTDNGPQFCSNEMEDFLKMFKIKHVRSTPYHAASNGCVENFNGSLKKCLLRLCQENTKQWDSYIGPCLYGLRETVHSSTGFSPNECVFGRTLKSSGEILRQLFTDDQVEPETKTTYQHVLDLRNRIQETCKLVKSELANSQQKKQNTIR